VVAGAVTGVGASSGVVEGLVRVVLDLAQLADVEPGDVLVCPMTSPGWDLAFALAAAVVTDGGGLVSHSALLAREVGIPAVVGTKVGTAVLQTGQRVVVDGAAGTVTPIA
jgi:phosphoenolpyruvate synthase/pyruvate phosphate dikinase